MRVTLASRELLGNLVMRELRGKYKGTSLGWFWSLLNPLASTLIFSVVFGAILRVTPTVGAGGVQNYTLFLLCALLPWNYFSGVVNGGMGSLLGNANLIKKTSFPRELLVLATTASLFVTFLIEMAVLAVALLVFGVNPLIWLVPTLLLMVVLAVFATGLGLMLAVANVYFRDSAHFVAIGLQVLFYATPVIYPITLVSDVSPDSLVARLHIDSLYFANPLVHYVEAFRDLLYEHQVPSLSTILVILLSAAASICVGWTVFNRFSGRLAEEL
ncbi:ABC transporter permease [uncultured Modestobacter sp.]|uniref:ABC transporter permease n=1 Tax=uncultured Modestobacter sp. TaxID=380048 RepID=UPI00260AB2B6|nr:ABC transporter permease [uncultured Modestobacter sp.]